MEELKTLDVDTKTSAENLLEHLSEFAETYMKLAGINAAQKTTAVATVSLTTILLSFFCMFTILFLGLGLSIWLGEALQDAKAGYFCVAGFFLLCGLLFLLLRKKVILPFVRDQIVRKVYE